MLNTRLVLVRCSCQPRSYWLGATRAQLVRVRPDQLTLLLDIFLYILIPTVLVNFC